MTPPTDLDAKGKALWKSAQKALEDQGTWQPHDVTTLEMLVRCEAEVRALRKAIGGSFTVSGSRGQDVAHPLIKPLHEAEKHFISYARELRFTPATRGDIERKPPTGGKFGDLGKP